MLFLSQDYLKNAPETWSGKLREHGRLPVLVVLGAQSSK